MFRSTDADLIAFDDLGQTFAQVLKLMQAELDVAVYTGTGTVEIRYGPALGTVVGLDTTYTDLDPLNLGPLRELINDLHLSTLLPSWTASHGGALLLRAVFEEEGTEIRGSLDFDLKHMEMQLFLVPGLNAAGEVNWKIETAVEIDGPALIDSMKQTIEDNILASGLTQAISDSLKPVTDILGLLLGLDTSDVVKTRYGAIHISDGVAEFTDPPPGGLGQCARRLRLAGSGRTLVQSIGAGCRAVILGGVRRRLRNARAAGRCALARACRRAGGRRPDRHADDEGP
jgi:hypothetical protein